MLMLEIALTVDNELVGGGTGLCAVLFNLRRIFTFNVPDWNFRDDGTLALPLAFVLFRLFRQSMFVVSAGLVTSFEEKKSRADFKFAAELIWAEFLRLFKRAVGGVVGCGAPIAAKLFVIVLLLFDDVVKLVIMISFDVL